MKHFYWSVTSTKPKLGDVILAKFEAFKSHILNIHTSLPNKIFSKCAHGEITKPRAWMEKGISNYNIHFMHINFFYGIYNNLHTAVLDFVQEKETNWLYIKLTSILMKCFLIIFNLIHRDFCNRYLRQ